MKTSRETSYAFVFKDELHFIDNVKDPGDISCQGFNLVQLKTLTGKPWLKEGDLKELSAERAKELFTEYYWDPLKCDQLPLGLDYFLFDSALVHGKLIATRWLQFTIEVPPTGTLSWADCKLIDPRDTKDLIAQIEGYRRKYIRNHSEWNTMGSLWSNRVTRARTRALKMAGLK